MRFLIDEIQYLGHVVTKERILVDTEKIKEIEDWSILEDVTDV